MKFSCLRPEFGKLQISKSSRNTCIAGLVLDQKILAVIVCQLKKKRLLSVLYCHHDYRLDYERYLLGGKFQNSKLFCHFYHTERLPQVIYVQLL
jgi:hypothetical protein